jgi:DNA polymerase-3 subunit delta'
VLIDVQGQPEGTIFLRRIVDRRSSPPLMLVGEEGVGRRFSVVQAAKEIFCQGTRTSDCRCSDCYQVDQGIHQDIVHISAPSDKEIGVDVVRQVVQQSYVSPSMAPIRFVIVDGAERLTVAAANALLKTLEEPPPTTRFFLLAESYDQVLPTIRSRCGRVAYHKLPESFVVSTLSRFEKDSVKALVYGRIAEGSIGRAIRYWGSNRMKLRDQVCTLFEQCANRDLSIVFSMIDEFDKDLSLALRFMDHLIHDLLICQIDPCRVINQDVQGQLDTMRTRSTNQDWIMLRASLKQVNERHATSYINLPFHVKSAFVSTFFS